MLRPDELPVIRYPTAAGATGNHSAPQQRQKRQRKGLPPLPPPGAPHKHEFRSVTAVGLHGMTVAKAGLDMLVSGINSHATIYGALLHLHLSNTVFQQTPLGVALQHCPVLDGLSMAGCFEWESTGRGGWVERPITSNVLSEQPNLHNLTFLSLGPGYGTDLVQLSLPAISAEPLHHLTQLKISSIPEPCAPLQDGVLGQFFSSPAGKALKVLHLDMWVLHHRQAGLLMQLQRLEELAGNLMFPDGGAAWATQDSLLREAKQQGQFPLRRLFLPEGSLNMLTALPLSWKIEGVDIGVLIIPAATVQERVALLQQVQEQARHMQLRVGAIKACDTSLLSPLQEAGLSALMHSCPIQLQDRHCFRGVALNLTEEETLGCSRAWGSHVTRLELVGCNLHPRAWRAFTSEAWPALQMVDLAGMDHDERLLSLESSSLTSWGFPPGAQIMEAATGASMPAAAAAVPPQHTPPQQLIAAASLRSITPRVQGESTFTSCKGSSLLDQWH
jgi:hypothetical protein